MNKKSIALGLAAAAICASSTLALAGCGNKNYTKLNNDLHYIVIEENGHHVLHHIDTWNDSESESVTISCDRCHNYIWTSANVSPVYKDKPAAYAYDFECGDEPIL